uniref:Terpene synthase N-terminal domain-containing protein n=1 Tax=Kalanchoe fedtschenkoi TaxID=63787 RepID=A0A7N0ZRG0_KALFE
MVVEKCRKFHHLSGHFSVKFKFPYFAAERRCKSWLSKDIDFFICVMNFPCGRSASGPVQVRYQVIPVNKEAVDYDYVLTLFNDETGKQIELVRQLLSSMEDGEISVSAYDTAWVALVEDVKKSGVPQFPTALEWIANNQLLDGSWGDRSVFLTHDRILNTLACLVALKTWNIHPEMIERGLKFVLENMGKLEGEDAQHMAAGFEIIIPTLLDMARALGMSEVSDMPCTQHIYAKRDLKLARIPKEVMHNMPTTLLFSLEGLDGLDWKKLLKLQYEDGSFISSVASTAFAAMQTKDEKCLNYLQNVVQKFQLGVPPFYPLSIYERLWAVNKVERLGISRHFRSEIVDCLSYVQRYWNDEGLSWTEPSPVKELDSTVIFHDVLRIFKNGGEFACFVGQMLEGPSMMFNLYRTSQVQFPGEAILEEAKRFSFEFLRSQQACDEILDKWMILKDLPANNKYLELAKMDYSNCQAIHCLEWEALQKWYAENKILRASGIRRRNLLVAYYLAAASIFEPERCMERVAWAKSSVLIESIICYFQSNKSSGDMCKIYSNQDDFGRELVYSLVRFLHELSVELQAAYGTGSLAQLGQAWGRWLLTVDNGTEAGGYMHGEEAALLVQTINICTRGTCGALSSISSRCLYAELSSIATKLCAQLRQCRNQQVRMCKDGESKVSKQIDSGMKLLVQLVLPNTPSGDVDAGVKQTFLTVAKSFYYAAYFDPITIDGHIAKILFEPVE